METGYISKYLTHFVGRERSDDDAFALLCHIIRDGRLLPCGDPNKFDGNLYIRLDKAVSGNKFLTPEMVCFCDIPLNRNMLSIHTKKYSKFGLAFDKKWLSQQGASPVFYLPQGSFCTDHRFPVGHRCRRTTRKDFFDLASHDWMKQISASGLRPPDLTRSDNMFLWYFLSYCKFFDEALPEDDEHNFYMEREWRTIGGVLFHPHNVTHVVLPKAFEKRFQSEFPDSELLCLTRQILAI